jgi:hypothetical protein
MHLLYDMEQVLGLHFTKTSFQFIAVVLLAQQLLTRNRIAQRGHSSFEV